jgi:transcriptional regulator with XRE-family HTH domain
VGVGTNIKERRELLGLSQEELCSKVGISQPMLSQIERGTKNPSLQVGTLIADALKCNVEDLTK